MNKPCQNNDYFTFYNSNNKEINNDSNIKKLIDVKNEYIYKVNYIDNLIKEKKALEDKSNINNDYNYNEDNSNLSMISNNSNCNAYTRRYIIGNSGKRKLGYAPLIYFKQLKNTSSNIAYYPFPDFDDLSIIKETYNITHILSCVERENYQNYMQNQCFLNNIEYYKLILPMLNNNSFKFTSNYNSNTCNIKEINYLISEIISIYNLVYNNKVTLLIHSTCGIQKSGLIIYCLFRLNGYNTYESRFLLEEIKRSDKKYIGNYLIDLFEKHIVKRILNNLNNNI